MEKLTVFTLPLTPRRLYEQLRGRSFCVSFATCSRVHVDEAIEMVGDDQVLIVDNGAFSHWQAARKNGGEFKMTPDYVERFETWATDILDRCPQAIAVIPDVIGGTVKQNAELVESTLLDLDRAMPIWHMHEPISYLIGLCERFSYVGFGSTCDAPGSDKWHARIREAFAAIDRWEAESDGAYVRPRIHMMRAQAFADQYPFDSSDSSNLAVNHCRTKKTGDGHVARLAARIDGKIQASAGPAVEHQIKRPLDDHLDDAAWQANVHTEMALRAAGFETLANQMVDDRLARSLARLDAMQAALAASPRPADVYEDGSVVVREAA